VQRKYSITQLKEKILDSNARSIFIDAHPKKSINKIDLISIANLSNKLDPKIISNKLLSNESFKIKFPINFKNLSDNKNDRKLLYILRKNIDFINELNLDPIGIGYPLIEIPDFKKKRINTYPILVWDIQISGHLKRTESVEINRRSKDNVYINPSLVSIIRRKYDPNFKSPKLFIENIDFKNILDIVNKILLPLKCKPLDEYHPFYPLDFFQKEAVKFFVNHKPKIINNGIIGLYAGSKEAIMSDYNILENETIPCNFKIKKNLNDSLYSGVALDHSQQRVVRTINMGKDIVIHGPPGTGKSKTLTAAIAYILSKGQTCLIVCEKKTAIDVLYKNLSELGFEEYCINISEVKKDRRKVINKVRDILLNLNKGDHLFTEEKTKEKKYFYSSTEEKIVNEKIIKVQEVISLINKTKKKLYNPLLGEKISYSDLVIKIKSNRYKQLEKSLGMSKDKFSFTINEFERLKDLFKKTYEEYYQNFNPYNSFYDLLDDSILDYKKDQFISLISTIYKDYFDKLIELRDRLEKALVGKSTFAFKYLDYIDSDDTTLDQIKKEYLFYSTQIKKINLFSSKFKNQLKAIDLNQKINLIIDTIKQLYTEINQYDRIKKFHSYYLLQKKNDQVLVNKLGTIDSFEKDFFDWYCSYLLHENHIDNFDFNGFEKGYYDIETDVKQINNFIINKTSRRLTKRRVEGIQKFKKIVNDISIEQFFAKKSTPQRLKHSLTHISSHKTGIFKSFFPVCMTNPSSCSSLFPMEKGYFDYVIFDESSQLKIEDTFTSMIRGKKSIIAGDLHQLPPMDYFTETGINDEFDSENKYNDNTKSLLDFCIKMDFNSHYLDIHYRSKHPDLINFSNAAFYKSRLIPKPPIKNYKAIEFYPLKGKFINRVNKKEASNIVKYIKDKIPNDQSVGVATFSLKQREEVLNQLEIQSKVSLKFYKKLQQLQANGFFVKNIENIQGEERDIIIIGTTYGLNEDGVFKERLGPINTKKRGHKLLNVIITRAINKIVVFSSIPKNVYSGYKSLIQKNGNRGKSILYAYLNYVNALNDNDENNISKVLDVVSQKQYGNRLKSKFSLYALSSFTKYLIEKLSTKLDQKISFQNYFKIGGYEFEIALKKNSGEILLIDINGKVMHKGYEDYIFDIDRCKIAQKSNHKYYRLWMSNFYNNPDFELNKLKTLLHS
jgi:superfamily I DNA and/or RNA helicase